jgi:putative tryptophan/tyrosine transport system substrate-binding protein
MLTKAILVLDVLAVRRFISTLTAILIISSTGPAFSQAGDQVRRIGVLTPTATPWMAISKALALRGFVEGQNLRSDVRVGQPDQFPALARELIASKPQLVLAFSTALGVVGALTTDIPIVAYGPDPVEQGFAKTHARPGGNVTGVSIFAARLDAKRLELLREGMPGQRIAVLLNPAAQTVRQSRQAVETTARTLGIDLLLVEATGPKEYPAAFATMRAAGVRALVITATSWFYRDRDLLGGLAREAEIATMCEWGDMAQSACTMGYGPVRADLFNRAATQIARVLQGTHPRDIPIEQPTKFELVINAKAAQAIGAIVLPSLLARADEVIE